MQLELAAGHVSSETECQGTFLSSLHRRVLSRHEAALGLSLGPVLTFGGGPRANFGAMAKVPASRLAALALSRGPTDLVVAPSQGLVTFSVFGPHLAPRVSEGLQRLDQVGLETDPRATVTSFVWLAVVGTLMEARAAVGDGIGLPKECAWPGGTAVARGGGKRSILHHRGSPALKRA